MINRLLFRKATLLSMVFFILHFIACKGKEPVPKIVSTKTESVESKDSIPVLLIGSFLNDCTSLSVDSLVDALEKGRISCTADIVESIRIKLTLSKQPRVSMTGNFDFKDPETALLTTIDSVDNRFLAIDIDSVNFFRSPDKYPLWLTASHPFDPSRDLTRYAHTGVTAITRQTGNVLDRNGIDFLLKNIEPFFTGFDFTHVSNEVSMQEGCSYPAMKMKFATKPEHFEILKRLHVNIVELTGNHNLDVGKDPYLNTFKWYDDNNMRYFGGGKDPASAARPLVVTLRDSSKVAWVGFNELCPCGECADKSMGANRYSKEKAAAVIDSLRKKTGVGFIMVCVQYGETDSYIPTSSQKAKCHELIDLGADAVVGSQAHQVQQIALYKGKPIFYGMGNFLFDQIHTTGVRQAYFMECVFYKGKIIQFRPVYTFMGSNRQPNIATPNERETIRRAILKKENF
ncbi:MAG: CapA family protein [Bacteroidota bacterium]